MKRTYHIVNNYDANDFFAIEAENETDAAFEGLRQLGHFGQIPPKNNGWN